MFMKKTALATTALAVAIPIVATAPSNGASGQAITACGQTATANASLTKDLDCAGTSGIVIGAPGITIDLKGHVLKGDRLAGHYGVHNDSGYDRVTIKNGVVRSFDYGIFASNHVPRFTVSNVVASGNAQDGVYVFGPSATIVGSTAAGNGRHGVSVDGDLASVTSSTAVGNGGEGILLQGARPTIRSSRADGNAGHGIQLLGNSPKVTSTIADGNSGNGITVSGDRPSVKSSTASGNDGYGLDVWGDAAVLIGNKAAANGFVGGVSNGVGPGISSGGSPTAPVGARNVARGNDASGAQCIPSTLCPAVGSKPKGSQITTCGQVATQDALLTQDLTCTGTGIFVGASGITIDLNGHVLKGNSSGPWGISNLGGYDNVTIQNGVVRNFTNGVVAWNSSDHITVSKVVASGNANKGVEIIGASARITASTVAQNGQTGIHVQGNSASVAASTVVSNGAEGIWLQGTAPTVKSSSAVANNPSGIRLEGTSLSVASSTAFGNALFGLYVTGDSAAVKSTTAVGNASHGIGVFGDSAALNGNRANGNGLPGSVSDGFGMGIYVGSFAVAPSGTNVASGNDDPAGCNPSVLC